MKSNLIWFLDSNLPREILLARQKFKWYFIEMLNSRWFDNRISISLLFLLPFSIYCFLIKTSRYMSTEFRVHSKFEFQVTHSNRSSATLQYSIYFFTSFNLFITMTPFLADITPWNHSVVFGRWNASGGFGFSEIGEVFRYTDLVSTTLEGPA